LQPQTDESYEDWRVKIIMEKGDVIISRSTPSFANRRLNMDMSWFAVETCFKSGILVVTQIRLVR
jgi:hypothetical protein